jgi:hypothetical protein
MSVLQGIRGLSCVLALASSAAQAGPDAPASPRLEIETLQQWEPSRRVSDMVLLSSQRLSPAATAFNDDGLSARWWWGRDAIQVGVGGDWRAPSSVATEARPLTQVVGVRAALSDRTRLIYEAESAPAWRRGETTGPYSRRSRVALEFKSKSPVSDLRNGLMRVQLTGDAAVHFKPRGGGLQVMYRERF